MSIIGKDVKETLGNIAEFFLLSIILEVCKDD